MIENSMNNDKKDLFNSLDEISKVFNDRMKELEDKQETYWNSLSKEQQLSVFCAISRRIYDGELEKQGSYRYILYDVFGFGPESYVQAQYAGYLSIHNSIYPDDHDKKLLLEFCKKYQIENAETKVSNFIGGNNV